MYLYISPNLNHEVVENPTNKREYYSITIIPSNNTIL